MSSRRHTAEVRFALHHAPCQRLQILCKNAEIYVTDEIKMQILDYMRTQVDIRDTRAHPLYKSSS